MGGYKSNAAIGPAQSDRVLRPPERRAVSHTMSRSHRGLCKPTRRVTSRLLFHADAEPLLIDFIAAKAQHGSAIEKRQCVPPIPCTLSFLSLVAPTRVQLPGHERWGADRSVTAQSPAVVRECGGHVLAALRPNVRYTCAHSSKVTRQVCAQLAPFTPTNSHTHGAAVVAEGSPPSARTAKRPRCHW